MTLFTGFPKELPGFFNRLKQNNTKAWFQAHKKEYETVVKVPSQEFVVAAGSRIAEFCPGINAIPKVNKSLFRINRDTRFSKDKSPYKTNLGILFWDGPGKRMESSGFYFHLEDNGVMLGCGMHLFTKSALQAFRDAVARKESAKKLEQAVNTVTREGYLLGTKHYKRIPRGFDAHSDLEKEFLLYNGLTARVDLEMDASFFSPGVVDMVTDHFKAMHPLHKWLVDTLQP